jgi:hypothetical protein
MFFHEQKQRKELRIVLSTKTSCQVFTVKIIQIFSNCENAKYINLQDFGLQNQCLGPSFVISFQSSVEELNVLIWNWVFLQLIHNRELRLCPGKRKYWKMPTIFLGIWANSLDYWHVVFNKLFTHFLFLLFAFFAKYSRFADNHFAILPGWVIITADTLEISLDFL